MVCQTPVGHQRSVDERFLMGALIKGILDLIPFSGNEEGPHRGGERYNGR